MTYLTYAYCALTIAWLAYLLFRSRKLRLPERLGVCRNASLLEVCVLCIWIVALLALAVYAALQEPQGVWALLLPLMLLSTGFAAVLSLIVRSAMAFTADGFIICGLFGAPKKYAWADVTDCRTMEQIVPRSSKLCNMYFLKLPGRDVALYDYKPGVCAFINELRRRKPMLNISVPGRKKK